MLRICTHVLASFLLPLALACAEEGASPPSSGAKGMPGAVGTIEFTPTDRIEGEPTWWIDSDGVDPGVTGCHVGTDANGSPNDGCSARPACPTAASSSRTLALPSSTATKGRGSSRSVRLRRLVRRAGRLGGACAPAPAPPC